jgi:hypothetical protein
LHCTIYKRDGSILWTKNIIAKLSKASAAGILSLAGPIGSIAGNAGYVDALRAAGEGATQQALEQLNDALLAERTTFNK